MLAWLMWLQFSQFPAGTEPAPRVHEQWHAAASMAAESLIFSALSADAYRLSETFVHGHLMPKNGDSNGFIVFSCQVGRLIEDLGYKKFALSYEVKPQTEGPHEGLRLWLDLDAPQRYAYPNEVSHEKH